MQFTKRSTQRHIQWHVSCSTHCATCSPQQAQTAWTWKRGAWSRRCAASNGQRTVQHTVLILPHRQLPIRVARLALAFSDGINSDGFNYAALSSLVHDGAEQACNVYLPTCSDPSQVFDDPACCMIMRTRPRTTLGGECRALQPVLKAHDWEGVNYTTTTSQNSISIKRMFFSVLVSSASRLEVTRQIRDARVDKLFLT